MAESPIHLTGNALITCNDARKLGVTFDTVIEVDRAEIAIEILGRRSAIAPLVSVDPAVVAHYHALAELLDVVPDSAPVSPNGLIP